LIAARLHFLAKIASLYFFLAVELFLIKYINNTAIAIKTTPTMIEELLKAKLLPLALLYTGI